MADANDIYKERFEDVSILSGNQAIARAALEAGVNLVTGYPGTPSTYVITTLENLVDPGFRVEWAINEKVAFELATGVSWAGLRSLVTMKMSGLNVASDAFLSVVHSGTKGGLVLYVADDPNTYYGMVEQDSRYYARMATAPMLEPATPQEALDFTRRAFDLSEQVERPVMVRGTTILANTYEPVRIGEIRAFYRKPAFEFNIARYSKAGPTACVRQHQEALAALERFGILTDDLNPLELHDERIGVISVGITWNYLQEVLHAYHLTPSTLKVGVVHPLPLNKMMSLLSHVDVVVVLEELEPLVEEAVLGLLGELGRPVKMVGKIRGPLSRTCDYDFETVARALREVYGDRIDFYGGTDVFSKRAEELQIKRLNTFCAGCPHRATYYALNQAIEKLGFRKDEIIITGDIGCTILGMNEPFQSCWTEISMGSSISLAQGFIYAGIQKPVVATIGDGTFFHAGLPAMMHASHHRVNLTVIILDNGWISMTGWQPNVGTNVGTKDTSYSETHERISIEEVVRALKVKHVSRINPYQSDKMICVLMEALSHPELSVVISDAECSVQKRRTKKTGSMKVKPEFCIGLDVCMPSCVAVLACPAFERGGDGKVWINSNLCNGCGLCHHVCPHGAI